MRQLTLDESVRFILAAAEIRDDIDRELGELLLAAHDIGTPEAWSAVHDRFNVIGRFDVADAVRNFVEGT